MKTLVLDATELRKEWLCVGLKYQLLQHMFHATWVSVHIPASVLDETVANYGREVEAARRHLEKLNRSRRSLGLEALESGPFALDLRAYLTERFDEVLGFTVMPWPTISHEDLVRRAVNRTPPFDERGSGYRDSLVWADVLALAREGRDVAFVTDDKIFASSDRGLAPSLQAEVDAVGGTVELVTDLASWLLAELPWDTEDTLSAVAASRDDEFYAYYLQSDLQEILVPDVGDLGLRTVPHNFNITEVAWGGSFSSVEALTGPDRVSVVTYDLDQNVEFEAEFPEGSQVDGSWKITGPDALGRLRVAGELHMIVRLIVLFGTQSGFTVDQVSWRRADGATGIELTHTAPDPDQLPLFGSGDSG